MLQKYLQKPGLEIEYVCPDFGIHGGHTIPVPRPIYEQTKGNDREVLKASMEFYNKKGDMEKVNEARGLMGILPSEEHQDF